MNSRQLKRGKDVVSLTLTEIMLVLTVVVLVLLLGSEIDLKASRESASEAQKQVAKYRKDADKYLKKIQNLEEKMKEQHDIADEMAKEVRGEWSLNGTTPHRNDYLNEQDVQTVRNMKKELSQIREYLESEKKKSGELREQLAGHKNELAGGRGDKYGYIPCWPRTGQGTKERYHTYDVTYDHGLFKIKLSSDWSQPEVSSREKLDAKLFAVLRNYPRAVSEQDFAEFGKRVENVLAGMRGDNFGGWYKPRCSLVVTINRGAPISAAIFIRQNVKMFPIGR